MTYKRGGSPWRGLAGCLFILVAIGGCSVAGQWRTTQRALPQHWTMAEMTLTTDGRYTATDLESANTETGSYKWNGSKLELWPTGGPLHAYTGRVTGDGALLLSEPDSKNDTVRYEKVGE